MGYTTGDQAGRNQLKTLERHAENHNRWYMGCTLPGAACPCAYKPLRCNWLHACLDLIIALELYNNIRDAYPKKVAPN